jgi:hypothetical protein
MIGSGLRSFDDVKSPLKLAGIVIRFVSFRTAISDRFLLHLLQPMYDISFFFSQIVEFSSVQILDNLDYRSIVVVLNSTGLHALGRFTPRLSQTIIVRSQCRVK